MNKIALVVGHNKLSKGAVGDKGISEYDFNTLLVNDIIKILEPTPIKDYVKIFFRPNKHISYTHLMSELHNEIDNWGADIALSFHFNASSNKNIDGHEVLYSKYQPKAKRLATMLNDEFNTLLNNVDRGVKAVGSNGRGNSFLRKGKSLNILAEPFFASHQSMYITEEQEYQNLMGAYLAFILKAIFKEDII